MDRSALLSELATVLPRERLITDPAELFVYEADGFTIAKARPAAVCFPTSVDEVARLMKVIAKHGAQIVPRGSGTGLTGGCVAFDLGVIISTAKMNRILKLACAIRRSVMRSPGCRAEARFIFRRIHRRSEPAASVATPRPTPAGFMC
jgi:glycolate oxidase